VAPSPRHQRIDGARCLLLQVRQDVPVGVERDADRRVSEALADDLGMHIFTQHPVVVQDCLRRETTRLSRRPQLTRPRASTVRLLSVSWWEQVSQTPQQGRRQLLRFLVVRPLLCHVFT
jgi:hypothetical protein